VADSGDHDLQPSEPDREICSLPDVFESSVRAFSCESTSVSGSAFVSCTVHFDHDLVLSFVGANFGGGGSRGASGGSAAGGENLVQPASLSTRCGRSGVVGGADAVDFSGLELSISRILDAEGYCGCELREARGASDGALRVS